MNGPGSWAVLGEGPGRQTNRPRSPEERVLVDSGPPLQVLIRRAELDIAAVRIARQDSGWSWRSPLRRYSIAVWQWPPPPAQATSGFVVIASWSLFTSEVRDNTTTHHTGRWGRVSWRSRCARPHSQRMQVPQVSGYGSAIPADGDRNDAGHVAGVRCQRRPEGCSIRLNGSSLTMVGNAFCHMT